VRNAGSGHCTISRETMALETTATLDERLTTLEMRLDSLQRLIDDRLPQNGAKQKRGWRAIVGTFADDPLYDEAMRLGRAWRALRQDEAVPTNVIEGRNAS
jgi:hypothetical protein